MEKLRSPFTESLGNSAIIDYIIFLVCFVWTNQCLFPEADDSTAGNVAIETQSAPQDVNFDAKSRSIIKKMTAYDISIPDDRVMEDETNMFVSCWRLIFLVKTST